MSEMGSSIQKLREEENQETDLIRNIREDYAEQTQPLLQQPQQLQELPIINEIQHQRQEEIEQILPPKPSMWSTIFSSVKDIIIFIVLFITFNYEPISLVFDSFVERLNVPYLGLIVRAIIAAVIFYFIKKVI